MDTEAEEAEAFERTPEYCDEDSIERWIELKRSGCVFFDNGHIEDKVEKLLEENKTMKVIKRCHLKELSLLNVENECLRTRLDIANL